MRLGTSVYSNNSGGWIPEPQYPPDRLGRNILTKGGGVSPDPDFTAGDRQGCKSDSYGSGELTQGSNGNGATKWKWEYFIGVEHLHMLLLEWRNSR